MKTRLYTNCSLVRVPIKAGTDEYYLPTNVEWASRKIDRLMIVAPTTPCVDPVDGVTPVLDAANIADLYITLYDADNREIMHDVSYENVLHMNNNILDVDAQLNLSLCKLTFTSTPAYDATLLIYVFYGTREEEYYDLPKNSITCTFELQPYQEMSFRDIIEYAIHSLSSTVKGIICWKAIDHPVWVSLRDHELTYQMLNIHSELMRPDMSYGAPYQDQAALFLMNDLNIDFDYSRIIEAAGITSKQVITFLF